jgi:diguanylate cyclase (GGDEF)-like protein/PAS domain S-box-containing protein
MNAKVNHETILVVDDEPQVLTAIQDSLEEDFEVLTADSPIAAIEILKKNGNDLSVILSDQRMPGMNGHEFLSRAKGISSAERLLITGFSDLEAVIAAVNEGKIFGYISKPWDPAALKLVVYKAAEHHNLLKQLREREERFRQLAENINDVFWIMSAGGGKYDYVSPAYEQIWGRSAASLLEAPESRLQAIHPDDYHGVLKDWENALSSSRYFEMEYRIVRPDASMLWVHDRGFPVRNEEGQVYRYAGIVKNVTELKQNSRKIARLNRVYALLSGINSAIVRIKDQQALFAEACELAADKGKFLLAWIGMHEPANRSVPLAAHAGADQGYLDSGGFSTEEHMRNHCRLISEVLRTGAPAICNDISTDPRMTPWKERAVERGFHSIVVLPIAVEDQPTGFLALYAGEPGFFTPEEMKLLTELCGDISYALQNIRQQEKLDYLAYYDALTGLPNHSLFHEHLSYMLSVAKQKDTSLAVLVFDIRQFRHINNVYGKLAGDRLLQEVATRLQKLASDPGVTGRISGDYFSMIVPDTNDATAVAHLFKDEIVPAISEPVVIDGDSIQIDISGGIAVYPGDGDDADTLYSHAEAALKQAKKSGYRYLFYQPEMTVHVGENLLLQNKLRHAMEQEQYILHYQPMVDTVSRRIIGLEALIRWQDPESGLVPPDKFIPILEETGMILEVGNWALKKSLKDYRFWRSNGIEPPRISVNVSALQLQQKNFVDVVAEAIKVEDSESYRLELEVTESLLMEDIEENIIKLAALRDMGIDMVIDDFGTGYCSFGYLAKLPVNALKIDRTFISTMTSQPESMTIVSSIISLARSLKLRVIAEGVETEEQFKFMRLLNCDELQGYLFGKPLPPAEIIEMLRKGRIE